jgi:hypothetical protein
MRDFTSCHLYVKYKFTMNLVLNYCAKPELLLVLGARPAEMRVCRFQSANQRIVFPVISISADRHEV